MHIKFYLYFYFTYIVQLQSDNLRCFVSKDKWIELLLNEYVMLCYVKTECRSSRINLRGRRPLHHQRRRHEQY